MGVGGKRAGGDTFAMHSRTGWYNFSRTLCSDGLLNRVGSVCWGLDAHVCECVVFGRLVR